MMWALHLVSFPCIEIRITFVNHILDGNLCTNLYDIHFFSFSDFLFQFDHINLIFSHSKVWGTVIDDVTNWVTHRIFNTNWKYSSASFTLAYDIKILSLIWGFSIRFHDNSEVAYFLLDHPVKRLQVYVKKSPNWTWSSPWVREFPRKFLWVWGSKTNPHSSLLAFQKAKLESGNCCIRNALEFLSNDNIFSMINIHRSKRHHM